MNPFLRRSLATTLACVTVAASVALVATAGVAGAANASVSATSGNVFEPGRVVVNVGDTVTWTTTGGLNHTVTSSTTNWRKDDSIPAPGRSTTYTFRAAGQYNYFCETHGTANSGMRGVVIVSAPPRATPAATRTATPRPSASPTRTATARPTPSPSRTPSRSPSARPSPSRLATPRPSVTPTRAGSPSPTVVTAPPIGVPSAAPAPVTESPVPLPTVAEAPSEEPTVDLGSGGLGPRPTTGRGRGLPAFLALVALFGVVSAQVRALLALPADD